MGFRYVSIFSGVEAASLAWEPLGWEPVAFSEIEPFPCAVLAERWPDVPNLGDITKIDWKEEIDGAIDLVVGADGDPSFTLLANHLHMVASEIGDKPAGVNPMLVRRLTPLECERLQGFPDEHTLIAWKGKPAEECPDGPRYKAIGNSMAVPVMRWIGRRIAAVDKN